MTAIPYDHCQPATSADDIRTLNVQLPRTVISLHQIEITSHCNLRCSYCPSRSITTHKPGFREPVDMSEQHFDRAMAWVDHYVRAGTQRELNLAGIGESTMHPQFIEFLALARKTVGDDIPLTLATNGVGYDESLVEAMAPYKPSVFVSLHRPEKAGRAVEWFKKHGLIQGVSSDPSLNANDWGGQVDWFHSGHTVLPCMWLRAGLLYLTADGDLSACCLDATGGGIVGHVDNPIGSVKTKPWGLCTNCHQVVGIDGYDQRAETSTQRLVQLRGGRPNE